MILLFSVVSAAAQAAGTGCAQEQAACKGGEKYGCYRLKLCRDQIAGLKNLTLAQLRGQVKPAVYEFSDKELQWLEAHPVFPVQAAAPQAETAPTEAAPQPAPAAPAEAAPATPLKPTVSQ